MAEDLFRKNPASFSLGEQKEKGALTFTPPSAPEPIRREVSRTESVAAAFELGRLDTAVSAIAKMQSLDELESFGELLPPEKLNEMFIAEPLEEPFNRPMTKAQALTIVDRAKERADLADRISRGPQDTLQAFSNFAGAAAASAADPLELGAGFLIGGGAGALARGGYLGVRATKLARLSAQQRLKPWQTLGISTAEGFAGNIAAEGLILKANQQENIDYTYGDAIANAAVGSLLFPGIRYGVNKTVSFTRNLGSQAAKYFDSPMLGRIFNDRKPVSDLFTQDLADELYARQGDSLVVGQNLKIDLKDFADRPIESLDDAATRNWFSYSRSGARQFDPDRLDQIELDYGTNMIEFSTDANVVYNAANRKMFNQSGTVFAHKVDMTGVIDFEGGKPVTTRDPFIQALQKLGVKDRLANQFYDEAPSMRALYESIRENIDPTIREHQKVLNDFNEDLVKQGINGFTVKGGEHLGIKGTPHNSLMILNKNNIKDQIDRIETDKKRAHAMKPEAINKLRQEYDAKENDIFYDAEASKSFDQAQMNPNPDVTVRLSDAINREKEIIQNLQSTIGDEGNEFTQNILDQVNRMKREEIDTLKISQELKGCLLRSG